jgi:hypothetical protein
MDIPDLLADLTHRIDAATLAATMRYAAQRRGLHLDPDDLSERTLAVLAHHLVTVSGDPEHAVLLAGYLGDGGLRCFLAMACSQWSDDISPGGPHANLRSEWVMTQNAA